ncbi:MAG: biotin--[acetyl-CoA-carboxylase] ligase, partial [Oscillospiraceae bacterium]
LTRASIWKAVDGLRKAGYVIEARTGCGYRLTGLPDVLTETEIRSYLGTTERVGGKLICLDAVDSTNSYARRLEQGTDGTVVVANCQTAGRGRMGRDFQSPADCGIYLSALLRPDLPPERLLPITALCAVGICNAVERVAGIRPQIKWTNDLVLGGKKLCGILTELALEGESGRLQSLVLGVGVNVGQTGFADLEFATSLYLALGRKISRPQLAAAMIEELDRLYTALLSGDTAAYLERYRRDCVTLGKQVQLLTPGGGRTVVQALDVDEQFGLVVRRADGSQEIVRSGEVSVRGMYGYVE